MSRNNINKSLLVIRLTVVEVKEEYEAIQIKFKFISMFKLWSFQHWRDTSTWHLRLYSRSLLNPAPSHSSSQSHPLWETTKRMVTSINVTSNQNPNWVLNRNLRVANFHPHILSMHLFSSTSCSSSSSWSHVVCGAATNAHFDKLQERHAYSVVVHTYSLHAPLTVL